MASVIPANDKSPGFRHKVLTSAKLSSVKFGSDIVLRLVSTVVLTRLLVPEAYGVFAIVLVYSYLLEMFSDLGIRSLILTKEGEVEDGFLDTCWTVSMLRGGLIALVSCGIAATIAALQSLSAFPPDSAYAAAVLPWAIAAIGATALLNGFHSPRRYMAERAMSFARVTWADVATNLAGLLVTIVLAYYLRSVWALVLGSAARAGVMVGLSFYVFPGPPLRLSLARAHLALVIGRGKWIIGHSILTALSQAADRLVLGFVMSSSVFGFYFIARQIVDLFGQFLTTVDSQMGLQVFTHILKATPADFRRNYYRYRFFFDGLAGLGTGGFLVLAPLLVDVVLDDRYAQVAPLAQILILATLLTGPLLLRGAFSAERRFREMTVLSLVSTATLWAGLAIAIFLFGSVTGALYVIALHRLPEAGLLWASGARRGWIIAAREALAPVFVIPGAALGWAVLALWEAAW